MRFTEILLIILFVLLIVYKFFSRYPTFSDSLFYINVNRMITVSYVPYKNFFFAHPPFQFYIYSFLSVIRNYSFIYVIVLAFQLIVFVLLYKILIRLRISAIYLSIFLLNILFFVFLGQLNGYWESLVLFLIAFTFLLRGDLKKSSLFYVLSVFTRYYSLFYFPVIVFFARERFRFIRYTTVYFALMFLLFVSIFGYDFVKDTFIFEFNAKMRYEYPMYGFTQIITFYPFYALLGLISLILNVKSRYLFPILYILIVDLFVILLFKGLVYHYFILSVSLVSLFSIKSLSEQHKITIRYLPFLVTFLVLVLNMHTVLFYTSGFFVNLGNKISKKINNGEVFGEPIMLNYLNFTYGIIVFTGEFDTYYQHLLFDNKFLDLVISEKPKYIIDLNNYYMGLADLRDIILNNYQLIYTVEDNGFRYNVYEKV